VNQIIRGKEAVFELSCFHQMHKQVKEDKENSVSEESENEVED